METRVWLNRSQPQTLYNATILLYVNAVFDFLFGTYASVPLLVSLGLVGANVGGGYGIANEQKWGYKLAVAAAFAPAAVRYLFFGFEAVLGINLISLLFEVVLIVLVLHPQSKEYQRIWFK